jgi:hypothetical protein
MTRLLLLTASAFAMLASSPAMAQMVCGERVTIVKALEAGHQEQKTATGLSGNGGLVELFTGDAGSWTLLLTLPGGPTCLLGAGEAWEGWTPDGDSKGPQNTSMPVTPGDST